MRFCRRNYEKQDRVVNGGYRSQRQAYKPIYNLAIPQANTAVMGRIAGQAFTEPLFVNEKTVSGKIDAIGVMVKRAVNFDKAHGDWEYFYADQWGAFSNGRLTDCIAYHQQAKSPDYVFYPRSSPKP